MRNRFVWLAALCAPVLVAQDDKKAPPAAAMQMPSDPKTKEHEALKTFAGTWETTCKMEAMPGEPGMEKPQQSTGAETAELICNGLYLKSIVNGTFGGQPFQGMWLMGWDPHKKTYTSLWVDNHSSSACTGTGTYDAAKKTWEIKGETPKGPVRSVLTFSDADNSKEVCYMSAGGKEVQMMEITRKRTKAAAGDASTKTPAKAPTKEHEELLKTVGTWDATMKMQMDPSAPAQEMKAVETIAPICHGHWLWSDYRGDMMGSPFEGHALVGYDSEKKQCVSFWLDSMSPVWMTSTGTHDPATKTVKMAGKGVDDEGKPMTSKETITWKDENTRVLNMEFQTEKGPMSFEITYKRKGKG